MRFFSLCLKACLAWLLVVLAACQPRTEQQGVAPANTPSQDAEPTFLNTNDAVAYVGDAACIACHESHYEGYQAHGMARSYYPLTSENIVEDFPSQPVYHEATDYYYRAVAEEGKYYQEEYRLGRSGEKTHRLLREMKYVMGSGNAARTYIAENNGRLYQMPLTWYTQTQTWDFSPGYDRGNKRFDRLIPDRCMACHNGYPESVPFAEGKYTEVPNGIGCERCHGPGALHVEERLATPEPIGDVDHTIINPAHLDLNTRLDVCQQCHLHTSVSVLRAGQTAFGFRPSKALASYLALFATEEPESEEQIGVISHADRMKQSACFIETQGLPQALECVTCHNPHEGFRDKGPNYFNDTCQSCHETSTLTARFAEPEIQANHSQGANCIACHMPKVQGEDTPHASFTDHLIRVIRPEDAAQAIPTHTPASLTPYFSVDQSGTLAEVYQGMAYIIYGTPRGAQDFLEKGIAQLENALQNHPELDEGQYLLGYAYIQLGQTEQGIPYLEEAVRLNPDLPERLNTLAEAYEATGRDPTRIQRLYQRALGIQPAAANIRLNYGRFLETRGQLDAAIAQYQQAIAEEPWEAIGFYNLGTAYLQKGLSAEAEAQLQQALALNPDYAAALSNLGLLYATRNEKAKAETFFEQAVAADGQHAPSLANLGTFLLNENKEVARAIDLFTRAVALAPEYADALAGLSWAYFRQGDMAQARTFAERALAQNPQHPLARQIIEAI